MKSYRDAALRCELTEPSAKNSHLRTVTQSGKSACPIHKWSLVQIQPVLLSHGVVNEHTERGMKSLIQRYDLSRCGIQGSLVKWLSCRPVPALSRVRIPYES